MKKKLKSEPGKHDKCLFTLTACLISGPVSEKHAKKNPEMSRTIEIRGNQTLEDLHDVIFDAFEREDEHMYEFQFKGIRPNDPNAECYGLDQDDGYKGDVKTTTIGSLDLKEGEFFGYWFDFGDDWWHSMHVEAIADNIPQGKKYPKITKRVGKSPPQYDEDEW